MVFAIILGFGALPCMATNGPAALWVVAATHTPTHWNIPVAGTTCAELRGVTLEPLPPVLTVWVKSSEFDNTELIATRIGSTNDYAFCYFPPASGEGVIGACGTTIVAYGELGHNACNDLIDDGVLNGSAQAAAGFRFLDASSRPVDCTPLAVQSASWGNVKTLYQQ